jgi:hypothetical protein
VHPSFAIVFRPRLTWEALGRDVPSWSRSLGRHALPLALVPAVAWPVGRWLAGTSTLSGTRELAGAFLATVLLTLASLLIVALAIYVLAPFFEVPRQWNRSVAVAAYSSTPVLLAGALLFNPVLIIASVAAFLHGLVLCSVGMNVLLGCRDSDTAAYVAAVSVLSLVGSMALGALCSAIGLI